jgi:hypothetical protein
MIDKKPSVGRIVMLESYLRDGFCRKGGKILGLTSKSVKYESDYGAPLLVRLSTVAAVCDTTAEESLLLDFNRRAIEQISDVRSSLRKDFQNYLSKSNYDQRKET